ncbi:hypothetical protein Undi14_01485 [Undibacterium sp. 14-3-2]|uniref:hypothetical protein n=1 Tax=Undibacterium sp. 14-3-2 TaxID=2800129 RepID=UPI001905F37B|nr:hypothetical protein [Undibacterium sp. 14-3-2]MBK1888689.1 hypothetical protein [Undibacterium sp. 14-3-2]
MTATISNIESSEDGKRQAYQRIQQEDLAGYVIGATDASGNTIKKIFARGDEYVIYEVEELPPIESIKVRIYTKIEENDLPVMNFQKAKDAFDRVKSVMYKTGADSSYRQRAASAIVCAILGQAEEAKKQFENIERDANEDYRHKVYGRLFYLLGATIFTLLLGFASVVLYIFRAERALLDNPQIAQLIYAMSFATLGGLISVSYNAKEVIGQRAISYWMYSVYGIERQIISVVAGVAIYVLVKSGIFLPAFAEGKGGAFFMASISFLSGFSEKLIPSYMERLEKSA